MLSAQLAHLWNIFQNGNFITQWGYNHGNISLLDCAFKSWLSREKVSLKLICKSSSQIQTSFHSSFKLKKAQKSLKTNQKHQNISYNASIVWPLCSFSSESSLISKLCTCACLDVVQSFLVPTYVLTDKPVRLLARALWGIPKLWNMHYINNDRK